MSSWARNTIRPGGRARESDLRGKRVAVVGTGSTGIQIIPLIAEQAEHLVVLQRTAQFSLPSRNRAMDEEYEREYKANYRNYRQMMRRTETAAVLFGFQNRSIFSVSDEERREILEQAWQLAQRIPVDRIVQRHPHRSARPTTSWPTSSATRSADRRRPGHGREAVPPWLPDRDEAAVPGHRVLRDLQPRQRRPDRSSGPNRSSSPRTVCVRPNASSTSTSSSTRPGSTR